MAIIKTKIPFQHPFMFLYNCVNDQGAVVEHTTLNQEVVGFNPTSEARCKHLPTPPIRPSKMYLWITLLCQAWI